MIRLGSRWSLAWKHPHRIEATIVALEESAVLCAVVHRCGPECELLQMRATLPIEGEVRYRYADFARIFVPMAEAIALPGGQS